jgi:hypothetical protein
MEWARTTTVNVPRQRVGFAVVGGQGELPLLLEASMGRRRSGVTPMPTEPPQ